MHGWCLRVTTQNVPMNNIYQRPRPITSLGAASPPVKAINTEWSCQSVNRAEDPTFSAFGELMGWHIRARLHQAGYLVRPGGSKIYLSSESSPDPSVAFDLVGVSSFNGLPLKPPHVLWKTVRAPWQASSLFPFESCLRAQPLCSCKLM